MAFMAAAGPATARADQLSSFMADASQTSLTMGDTVTFSIVMQGVGDLDKAEPSAPAFGNLRVVSGPSPSLRQNLSVINGVAQQSFQKAITWELMPPAAGEYDIGESQITYGGQLYKTLPIHLTVAAEDNSALPPSLRGEPILHPRSREAGINQQIKGRVFIRPVVTKTNPYVGEPVTLTFYFYFDPQLGPSSLSYLTQPDFTGALSETLFQAEGQWRFAPEQIDGKTFNKVTLFQYAITPTRPGELTLEGFGVRFRLPVRGNSAVDSFGGFGASVSVDAAAGPIKLNVQPLPTEGQPVKFGGTVGKYSLGALIDRREAAEGDIVTLTLKLEGHGAVSMAAPPTPGEMADFTVFDKVEKLDKWAPAQGPGGAKTLQWLLRPKHAGKLTIPPVTYALFDPTEGKYRELATQSFDVQVSPSASDPARPVSAAREGAPPELETGLRMARPILNLRLRAPEPLTESFFYWAVQALALAFAGGLYVRALRLRRIDPEELRRTRAHGTLERKLARLRGGEGAREQAAASLEKALLEYLADRTGARAEGLTRPDARRMLEAEGVPAASVDRLIAILDLCSNARFAPVGGGEAGFGELAREALETLREGEKS